MNEEQRAQARATLETADRLAPELQPIAIAYMQGMAATVELMKKLEKETA